MCSQIILVEYYTYVFTSNCVIHVFVDFIMNETCINIFSMADKFSYCAFTSIFNVSFVLLFSVALNNVVKYNHSVKLRG